jgi:hypothetical protein
MNLLLALFLLIEAVFEGLRTGGHLFASEMVEVVYRAGVALMAFAYLNKPVLEWDIYLRSFIKILIGYLLLRFALFDTIWNLCAGQDLFFYGTTKVYDRFMASLGTWGWMWKGISFIWGIAWLTKWGNKD